MWWGEEGGTAINTRSGAGAGQAAAWSEGREEEDKRRGREVCTCGRVRVAGRGWEGSGGRLEAAGGGRGGAFMRPWAAARGPPRSSPGSRPRIRACAALEREREREAV